MRRAISLAAVALAAAATTALPAEAIPGVGNGNDGGNGRGPASGGTGSTACNDGTVTWSPTSIWPPNHKMKTVTVVYDENDGDGDTITVAIDSITHDQFATDGTELVGSGPQNAGPDAVAGPEGSAIDPDAAVTTGQVRAERSGIEQKGRTYTLTVTCTDTGDQSDDDPQSETVTLTVSVPHDRRR